MKEKLDRVINVSITPGTIVKSILILVLFYFVFVLRDLFLVLLTSVVLASAVEPFTEKLVKKKIPRTLSAIIIYLLGIVIISASMYFIIPTITTDIKNILQELPAYISDISEKTTLADDFPVLNKELNNLSQNLTSTKIFEGLGIAGGVAVNFLTLAGRLFGGVLNVFLVLVLSFYLAVQEDGVANFLRIVTPKKKEKYILDLWKRSRRKIGLWMQGQIILGFVIGVLTYLGLSILGVENALVLALIAALFELIPVFGPVLAAIPAIGISLATGGVSLGLMVTGLYVLIQQFESQLIHPLVVKKMVGIPAMIAIISLIIGAELAGFLGIILSVPVTAAIMEFIKDVEKNKSDLPK